MILSDETSFQWGASREPALSRPPAVGRPRANMSVADGQYIGGTDTMRLPDESGVRGRFVENAVIHSRTTIGKTIRSESTEFVAEAVAVEVWMGVGDSVAVAVAVIGAADGAGVQVGKGSG